MLLTRGYTVLTTLGLLVCLLATPAAAGTTIHYDYDAMGRLAEARYEGQGLIDYGYDTVGNRLDAGTLGSDFGLLLEYAFTGTVIDHTKESVWHAIAFDTTFPAVPVLVADIQTKWGGEPVELRMRNLTGSGLEIMLEEDRSLDGESNHMAENVGYLALSAGTIRNAAGEIIGETGRLEAESSGSGEWNTLSLQHSYTQPIVRMQLASIADETPAHIRLRNVTGSSFDYRIEEWDCDDGIHATESIAYVVVDAGDHELPGNVRLLADSIDISADGSGLFTKVLFTPVFPETPVVLSQSQTANDAAAIVTRQKDITANRTKFKLAEEEAADQVHAVETVGYLAIGAQAVVESAALVMTQEAAPAMTAFSRRIHPAPMTFEAEERMREDNSDAPALMSFEADETLRDDSAEAPARQAPDAQPIPEPSLWALLGLGLLGLYLIKKFKRI